MWNTKTVGGALLVVGGLSWLGKLAVIIGTDGRVTDTGAAGIFYLLGLAGLVLGAAAVGYGLGRSRHLVLGIVLAVVGAAVVLVAMGVLQELGRLIVSDGAEPYWNDEMGILLSAVLWLIVGGNVVARNRSGAVSTAA